MWWSSYIPVTKISFIFSDGYEKVLLGLIGYPINGIRNSLHFGLYVEYIHYRSSSCGVIQIQFTLFYVGILLLRSLDIDDGAMQLMGFGQDSFFSEIGTSISFVCIYIYLYMYIHRVICKYIRDFLVRQIDYRGRMRNQFDSGFNTYIFIYK